MSSELRLYMGNPIDGPILVAFIPAAFMFVMSSGSLVQATIDEWGKGVAARTPDTVSMYWLARSAR
jgi:hypothetical protein